MAVQACLSLVRNLGAWEQCLKGGRTCVSICIYNIYFDLQTALCCVCFAADLRLKRRFQKRQKLTQKFKHLLIISELVVGSSQQLIACEDGVGSCQEAHGLLRLAESDTTG